MNSNLYRLAGFGRRFAAGLIDLVLVLVVFEAAVFLIPGFRAWVEASSADNQQLVYINLFLTLVVYAYYMLMLGPPGGGATVGYRVLRIKLVDQTSLAQPRWARCFFWCLASLALPVGWVLYWFDARRRMLHNDASRTIVIDCRP